MSKESNTRSYRKQEFWEAKIKEWEKSNLTQIEYCRNENLKPKSFTYWKNKIKKSSQLPTFVPVITNTSPVIRVNDNSDLRLVINSDFKVEIGDNFTPETLVRLIQTIEGME